MTFTMTAEKRAAGSAEAVRMNRGIPAVVYGPEIEPVSLAIDYGVFEKLYDEAGESSLIDLTVPGKEPVKVLIQEVQYDPVKGRMLHVDFRQIKMSEEMHATIQLNFIGESNAVKSLGGTLIEGARELNVKCLPKDLVGHIDVDLTTLKTFDDLISIKSLALPAGITVMDNPDMLVAKVAPPLTEEQLKAMEETPTTTIADIEVEKKKVKEGEEEEGAEKTEGAAKEPAAKSAKEPAKKE